jgi:hypothetical protein
LSDFALSHRGLEDLSRRRKERARRSLAKNAKSAKEDEEDERERTREEEENNGKGRTMFVVSFLSSLALFAFLARES